MNQASTHCQICSRVPSKTGWLDEIRHLRAAPDPTAKPAAGSPVEAIAEISDERGARTATGAALT
jgi:hypothetical protein